MPSKQFIFCKTVSFPFVAFFKSGCLREHQSERRQRERGAEACAHARAESSSFSFHFSSSLSLPDTITHHLLVCSLISSVVIRYRLFLAEMDNCRKRKRNATLKQRSDCWDCNTMVSSDMDYSRCIYFLDVALEIAEVDGLRMFFLYFMATGLEALYSFYDYQYRRT